MWQRIDLSDVGLSFAYPRLTPEGQHVVVDDVRIHVQSLDGRRVYLEVSRQWNLSAAQAHERERAYVRDRHGAVVEPLEQTTFAGWPAQSFSCEWAKTRRVFTYVERGEWLYQIVHDPDSALDVDILGTLRLQ